MADISTAKQYIPVYKKTDAINDGISGEFNNKKSQLYEFKYDENNSAEKKINKRKYKRRAKNNAPRRIKIGVSTNTNKKNADKKNGVNAKAFPKKVVVPNVDVKCKTALKKENLGSSNDGEPFCESKIPASVAKKMSRRITRSMKESVDAPPVVSCSTPIANLAGNSKRKTVSNDKNSVCSNDTKLCSDSKTPSSITKITSRRVIRHVEKGDHVPVIASCSTPTTGDLDRYSNCRTVSDGRKFLCSNNVELSFDSFEELLPAPEEFPLIVNEDVNVPVAADSFIFSPTHLKKNNDHSVSKLDNKTEDYCTYFGFECESNLDRVPHRNVKENPARIGGRAVKKKVTFKTPSPVAKMTIEEIQALLRGKSPSRDLSSVDSVERDTTACSDDSAVDYMNNSNTTVNNGILKDITNQELPLDSQSLMEKSAEASCCTIHRQEKATKYLQENNFPPSSADDDIAAEKKKKRNVYKKNRKVVEDKKFEDKFKLLAESLNSKFKEIEDFQLAVE